MSSYEEAYAYLERHVDALKTNRTGDERQTDAEVFDRKTLLTIYDMMTSGYIDQVHYPISTGKEGNVFYATDEDGEGMALKIFRTSTSTFKRVSKYVEGDPRFRGVTGNRWKMIYAWVNKEFRNLVRYSEAGIPVPEPITFAQNCLLMEYIGDESGPAPQLKDVVLEDPTDTYDEVISFNILHHRRMAGCPPRPRRPQRVQHTHVGGSADDDRCRTGDDVRPLQRQGAAGEGHTQHQRVLQEEGRGRH